MMRRSPSLASRTHAAALLAVALATRCGATPPAATSTPSGPPPGLVDIADVTSEPLPGVSIELYLMSGCKHAADIVPAVLAAQKKMGQYVSYTQHHIFRIHDDGSLSCLYGDRACEADLLLLCAQELHPEHLLDFGSCMFEDHESMPEGWKQCAEQLGLDPGPIEQCAAGEQGARLAEANEKMVVQNQVKGSPTMYIGGEEYRSARTSKAIVTAICMALPDSDRPSHCPEIEPVHMTVISDKRCESCDVRAQSMVDQFHKMFWELEVKKLDWSEAEAKSMMEQLGITLLPAYVFHAGVVKQESFKQIEKHVIERDGYYVLKPKVVRAEFDPMKELCGNGEDDTGNGLIDCADPDCAQALECRPEKLATLDLFVMSRCPYGIRAVNQIPAVLEKMGGSLDFDLHYITLVFDDQEYEDYLKKESCERYDDGMWYCSLHGKAETKDNIRNLCAAEVAPSRYLDYILCRNADLSKDWEGCAAEAGIKLKKMKKCIGSGKGLKLLGKSAELADGMGIRASPTYLINNKFAEKIAPESDEIVFEICERNGQMKSCEGVEEP